MDDINKAGEGSRGGTIIGHAPSGKPIYKKASHDSHKTFSPEDHKAAANLHEDIYNRANKKLQDKTAADPKYKPDQKVYDFIQHHHRQMASHTGGGQKPRNVSEGSKGAKAPAKKEERDPGTAPNKSEKKEFKSKLDNKVIVDTVNRLRGEGKTAEARRIYDKHINKAHDLLEALGKGGPGSGRKGQKSKLENLKRYLKVVKNSHELEEDPKEKRIFEQDIKDLEAEIEQHGEMNKEDLEKAKYIKREGSKGAYKYTYADPKVGSPVSHEEAIKAAHGKLITFSGPSNKEYSAHVYSEPEDGKVILKFDLHGFRRVDISSIKNMHVQEAGDTVAAKPLVKNKSEGWPPSGFVEPKRTGNKTVEKDWYKEGDPEKDGRPSTQGKKSKYAYMSPKGSTCNLVGEVAFGKASDKAQRQLNQKLQMTEVLLSDMGIKMKTPMDFICQDMADGQRGVMAQFLPMNHHRNDRINLAKNLTTVNKSLLHEIGHGIDYAMEQRGLAGSYFRGSPGALRTEMDALTNILKESKFYEATGAKDAPGNVGDDFLEEDKRYADYLKDDSEVFARAFEVYTYSHALDMVSEGKLPKEYTENIIPDFLRAGFSHKSISDTEKFDQVIDDVTEVMDRIFSKRGIQKAMQEVDLLAALTKGGPGSGKKGHKTPTDMLSSFSGKKFKSVNSGGGQKSSPKIPSAYIEPSTNIVDKNEWNREVDETLKNEGLTRTQSPRIRRALKKVVTAQKRFSDAQKDYYTEKKIYGRGGKAITPLREKIMDAQEDFHNLIDSIKREKLDANPPPRLNAPRNQPIINTLTPAEIEEKLDETKRLAYEKRIKTNPIEDYKKELSRIEALENPSQSLILTASRLRGKLQRMKKSDQLNLLEALRKNVVPTDDQGSATETGMYSNDLYSNASNPLMGIIKDALEDHMFGSDPVQVVIAPGTVLTATKVDDGVYSGHVTKETNGEVENVLKIEKQTLPTLLQFLKVKELIPPVVSEPEKEESGSEYKLKVINLLDKLL